MAGSRSCLLGPRTWKTLACRRPATCANSWASTPRDSVSFPRPTSTVLPVFFASASVTRYAILEVPNAFLLVFGSRPVRLMFVAPVTGIATEVVVDVACRTGGIVVAVEDKELLVVECGGLPMRRHVASRATVLDLTVHRVSRRFVTSLAAIQH